MNIHMAHTLQRKKNKPNNEDVLGEWKQASSEIKIRTLWNKYVLHGGCKSSLLTSI